MTPASARTVLLGALALLLAACGTGEDPTLLPEQTGPAPSLEALRNRADDATLALNEDRWLDLYEVQEPPLCQTPPPIRTPCRAALHPGAVHLRHGNEDRQDTELSPDSTVMRR